MHTPFTYALSLNRAVFPNGMQGDSPHSGPDSVAFDDNSDPGAEVDISKHPANEDSKGLRRTILHGDGLTPAPDHRRVHVLPTALQRTKTPHTGSDSPDKEATQSHSSLPLSNLPKDLLHIVAAYSLPGEIRTIADAHPYWRACLSDVASSPEIRVALAPHLSEEHGDKKSVLQLANEGHTERLREIAERRENILGEVIYPYDKLRNLYSSYPIGRSLRVQELPAVLAIHTIRLQKPTDRFDLIRTLYQGEQEQPDSAWGNEHLDYLLGLVENLKPTSPLRGPLMNEHLEGRLIPMVDSTVPTTALRHHLMECYNRVGMTEASIDRQFHAIVKIGAQIHLVMDLYSTREHLFTGNLIARHRSILLAQPTPAQNAFFNYTALSCLYQASSHLNANELITETNAVLAHKNFDSYVKFLLMSALWEYPHENVHINRGTRLHEGELIIVFRQISQILAFPTATCAITKKVQLMQDLIRTVRLASHERGFTQQCSQILALPEDILIQERKANLLACLYRIEANRWTKDSVLELIVAVQTTRTDRLSDLNKRALLNTLREVCEPLLTLDEWGASLHAMKPGEAKRDS